MAISEQIQQLTSRSNTYVLMQRFKMPTDGGSKDAIAVTVEVSKILLSFYTLMVNLIIFQLWYLFVLVAIAVVARKDNLTRNMGIANVAIWNSQASPLSVIKAMFNYRSHIPGYAFLWALAAFLAAAGAFVMSLLVSPELILGSAAPVNLQSIYVPSPPENRFSSEYMRYSSLRTPAGLRAIEVLQAVNVKTGEKTNASSFNVVVQDPVKWTDSNNSMYQVDYSYNVSGVDFGLQNFPNLKLEIQGSCRTEYSWYQGWNATGATVQNWYIMYNDTWVYTANVDTRPPFTTIFLDKNQQSGGNISFAFLTSSVSRRSFTPGTDPWYLTDTSTRDNHGAGYIVSNGRPVLLCWEHNLWSHNGGPKKQILEIDQLNVLPRGIVDIFKDAFAIPRITTLTQTLGTSGLKSAATAQGRYFDAESSSIREDLQRLVLGAYVATKNTLPEATMFDTSYQDKIPNLAFDQTTKQFKEGCSDFVIQGSGFAALSVRVLIVVPVVAVFLWTTVYLLTDNPCFPLPWAYVNALKAPVLYTAIDIEPDTADTGAKWKRTSQAPYYSEKESRTNVRPTYDHDSRTLSWDSKTQGQRSEHRTIDPELGTAEEKNGS